MAQVARITRIGGPDVIEWHDVDLPPPAPGEVRIRTTAVGLNYIDTYHRDGTYPTDLPAALGMEGVGEVTALGDGVSDLAIGHASRPSVRSAEPMPPNATSPPATCSRCPTISTTKRPRRRC